MQLAAPCGKSRMSPFSSFSMSRAQIVACFLIAAAGLIPVFHENKPFWGLYCIRWDDAPPKVTEVDAGSPANSAGLRVDDAILTVNDKKTNFESLMAVLDNLQPGETAKLRVQRGEGELDVTAVAAKPPIAVIYYPTLWHPIAGGIGFALALLLLATAPLQPIPRRRPTLLCIAGLILAVAFFLAIANDSIFAAWHICRYHNLNWGTKWHFAQNWVGFVASIVLAILGAWELRRVLSERDSLL